MLVVARSRWRGSPAAGRAARASVSVLVAAFLLSWPARARGQGPEAPVGEGRPQGGLADAVFEASFQKFMPPETIYSPYYSWDAAMGLDLTVFRKGSSAFGFTGVVQTAGTENLGTKVGVGGTGYVLRFEYERALSRGRTVAAGVSHLSSHLTRDLDDKTDERRREGARIPEVVDPDEYNAVFVRGVATMSRWPLGPEIEIVLQPLNFRFDFGRARYVRPVYVRGRWVLWRGVRRLMAMETQHEIGRRPFHHLAVSLELCAKKQSRGRFQVFASVCPGSSLHTSPYIGGLRGGMAVGFRMRFRDPSP